MSLLILFNQPAGASNNAAPGVGNIVLTGYAPTVSRTTTGGQSVAPGVGSITLTGYAPAVSQTVNRNANPGSGSIATTGYAPTVSQPHGVAPSVGSIALTGYAPSVARSVKQSAAPGVGSVTITGYAPAVSRTTGGPQAASPGAGQIVITGYTPEVSQSGAVSADTGDFMVRKPKKVYIRRRGNILLFDTAEQADAYIEAEEQAQAAIDEAKSRGAKKRIAARVLKDVEKPEEVISIGALERAIDAQQLPFDMVALLKQQDYQRIAQIQREIEQMLDEEEELLLLLA